MKKKLVILMVTVCWLASGCAPRASITVAGPKGVSAEAELIIHEVVFRNLIADERSGSVIYASFGKSWIDHVDPPDVFFERLGDVHVSLKPVSERGPAADRNTVLFEVRLIEWTSESEAKVSVTRYRFGVGASEGFTAKIEWVGGLWELVDTTGHWSS